MKNKFKFLMGIKIVAGITFFFLLCGFGTMLLWNWLVPVLFKGPIIVFWQAIGLLALSKILFGGCGRGWGGRGRCGGRGRWRSRMEERLKNMTPEEKEKFKNKCGGYWMKEEETKEQQ
jgi:hypothetical protein